MSTALPGPVIQAIRNRRGLLWVCQRYDLSPNQEPHDCGLPAAEAILWYRRHQSKLDVALASMYWEAVWLEGAASPVFEAFRKIVATEPSERLSNLGKEGDSLRTFSVRLPCEPGSGATTILRAAAYAAAAKVYPTIVMRSGQVDMDREELVAFATTLAEEALTAGVKNPPPLLVVLDVEHETIPDSSQVADWLASQGRSAVVLQAISPRRLVQDGEIRRRRAATLLPLRSDASPEQIRSCAIRFAELTDRWNLPITVPTIAEWDAYASAASMKSPVGHVEPQTMFWIALRFFLVEGMEFTEAEKASDAMGTWIRRRCEQIKDSAMLEVIRYIAALSAFRMVSPLWTVLRPVTGGSFDSATVSVFRQLEGVVEWGVSSDDLHDQVLRFLHPAVAREFLRQNGIRSDDGIVAQLNPVLSSLSPGHPGDAWVAETLAASVLAPSYEERFQNVTYDRRLEAFELIPPAVTDQSKAILHHWARCLYQSVDRQRVPDIDPTVQRERLEEAIRKLERATLLPRREGRDEHPSHLYNTLGTAYARHHILPRAQFPEDMRRVLESQCIPTDSALWRIDQAEAFWDTRRELLADSFNEYVRESLPQRRL